MELEALFGIYIETLSQKIGSLKIIAKEEKDGEHKLRFFLGKKKKLRENKESLIVG